MLLSMEGETKIYRSKEKSARMRKKDSKKTKVGFYHLTMKLKVFSIILLFSVSVFGQDTIKFNVLIDDKSIDDKKNQSFNIYNSESGLIGSEKVGVIFETILSKYPTTLYFYIEGFPLEELTVNKASDEIITVFIGRADQLNEVVLKSPKEKGF